LVNIARDRTKGEAWLVVTDSKRREEDMVAN
jgi:hypothetical protein